MSAPTSTNEVTARKLSSSISALWTKIKSTFQPVADRVTSVRASSSATDTNYPSEKAVAKAVESASVTDKLYANQKWGGAFRGSLSPLDTYFILNKNYFLGVAANCVSVEYSTDGGSTWIDYGLTDLQKRNLFNQFTTVDVYCGKNTHIQPGYTGSITGTKDLTDEIIADQRLRITISSRPFGNAGTTSRTGEWMICSLIRRFAIYMSTQSASSKTHCKVQSRTIANFCSGTNTWVDHGDYPIVGDSGWNSIPIGNDSAEGGFGFGSYESASTTIRSEFRFEIWSEKLNANPASSQTGNLCIKTICSIADKLSTTTSKFRSILYYGLCCTSVDMENGWPVFGNGIKFTARKLKTNLARTADSTFDGSADQLNIPVTGTLPVGNGGTGKSSVTSGNYLVGNGTSALTEKTPKDAGSDVLKSLDTDNGDVVDGDYIVTSYHVDASTISSTTFVRRTAEKLWNYIKSNISSVLGLSTTGYTGNAATATTAASCTGNAATASAAASGSELENAVNINYTYNVTSDTNINSRVLAGIKLPGSSLGSCRLMFAMVVNFNIGEGAGCGGLVKVQIEISSGGTYYVKRLSLSNVTGSLSASDIKIVEGIAANKKIVGIVWNNVLLANRPMQATILSRHVVGGDFVYNGDVSNGTMISWTSDGVKVWAVDDAVVHTTGNETIAGEKKFTAKKVVSSSSESTYSGFFVQRTYSNSTYEISLEVSSSSGNRGVYDYVTDKWIAYKDSNGITHVGGASDEPSTIRLGKLTIDTSGTVGTTANTLYIV